MCIDATAELVVRNCAKTSLPMMMLNKIMKNLQKTFPSAGCAIASSTRERRVSHPKMFKIKLYLEAVH